MANNSKPGGGFDLKRKCEELAPAALDALAEIMREGGRNSQARLGAIQQILDRAFGRPAAQVEALQVGGLEIIVSGPKSGPALPAPAAGEAAAGIEVSARALAADPGGAPALAGEDAVASGAQAQAQARTDQPGISAAGSQGAPTPGPAEGGRRAVPVPHGTGTSLSPGGDGPLSEKGSGLNGYRSFDGEDE